MPIQPLSTSHLRRTCDPTTFSFETTADLSPNGHIIGQPRGTRAIEFGIAMQSPGYNIYILGSSGTGRTTYISRFLKEKSQTKTTPDDWVYVQNFSIEHQPRAIEFRAGEGSRFKKRMEELLQCLKEELPRAFSTEGYEEAVHTLWDKVELKQSLWMHDIERKAQDRGFTLIRSASGMTVAPAVEGEIMTAEQYDVLSMNEQNQIDQNQEYLEALLEELVNKTSQLRQNARDELKTLNRTVAIQTITPHIGEMNKIYSNHDEVLLYLKEVQEDIVTNVKIFQSNKDQVKAQKNQILQRYAVNLFVDHSNTEGAPIIVVQNPTYNNLIGRIEFDMHGGGMSTQFTHIKPGSLHQANGGYLVIDATELISQPDSWEALKRALKSREIVLQPYNTLDGSRVLAKSLDPEAIPLDIKIILLGSSALYYRLVEIDDDFSSQFKVMADFGITMDRNSENELAYAGFIAQLCADEKLTHFDRSAVARIVEYGSELAGEQNKLSTHFSTIADLSREASFWSTHHERTIVSVDDVDYAMKEWIYRSNKVELLMDEQISAGHLLILTDGEAVGQINGLSVLDTGDYAFGRPMRITARTYMGSNGIVQIERETSMADSIHNKGVMTISGYLGGMYAHEYALSLSASITFEQLYGEISGDSASSTELYALLSSLSNLPIKQGIAVTGSVDQHGTVQPIGAVNEKIEGFFRVCVQQGLTGNQGVIIPSSNTAELMLDKMVVTAVEEGNFHIWEIEHIDEGLELLMAHPAGKRDKEGLFPQGSIHARVEDELMRLAKRENGEDVDAVQSETA